MARDAFAAHQAPKGIGGLERIRGQLVAALHAGQLRPGDRVPSVRRLAELTGLNRKTVHRAYRRLVVEGLVEMRPGSGTYLAEARVAAPSRPPSGHLVVAINRVRAEAASLGVDPHHFSRFLQLCLDDGLRDVPVAVAECNREQIGVFGLELRALLAIRPRPALLDDLQARARETLNGVVGVVTTDFHRVEVLRLAAPTGLPVYRVSLDPGFPKALIERAQNGRVVMIVSEASFAPRFLRFVEDVTGSRKIVERFVIVEAAEGREVLRNPPRGAALYVSPLVEEQVASKLPPGIERIPVRRHLSSASIERLRARLAFDLSHQDAARRLTPRG